MDTTALSLITEAARFARIRHEGQYRKYTNNIPYYAHCEDVANIVAGLKNAPITGHPHAIAAAYLHDVVEDCGVKPATLQARFGNEITGMVMALSDIEEGNRAARKEMSRKRLGAAGFWVQTIKLADTLSNGPSIMKHDPKFAKVFMAEKRALVDVLTKGHADLWTQADAMIREYYEAGKAA